jgi:hypothetical protein
MSMFSGKTLQSLREQFSEKSVQERAKIRAQTLGRALEFHGEFSNSWVLRLVNSLEEDLKELRDNLEKSKN